MKTNRLTVVSNRLAIIVDKDNEGQWTIKPGSGGLVTALGPVLRDRGGQWIGWLGSSLQGELNETEEWNNASKVIFHVSSKLSDPQLGGNNRRQFFNYTSKGEALQ